MRVLVLNSLSTGTTIAFYLYITLTQIYWWGTDIVVYIACTDLAGLCHRKNLCKSSGGLLKKEAIQNN
jgi:hypothetical protein